MGDIATIGAFLQQLNGLELIGIAVIYIIISGVWKVIYKKYIKKKEIAKLSHITCPLYPDFKLQLKLQGEKLVKIFRIENYDTIKKQMVKVDTALDACSNSLMGKYVDLIRQKYGSDDIDGSERDVDYYNKIIFHIFFHMKNKIKNRIIENHILDKSDNEFRMYIEHANKNLISEATALIDREYNSNYFLLSRLELKEYDLDRLEDVEEILETMWYDVRTIAERAKDEIRKIESE